MSAHADYLNAAEALAASLLEIKHGEKRSIAVSRILNVLAAAVDGTDAYEPITTVATEIAAQAQRNIQAQIDDMRSSIFEAAAFSLPRYNPAKAQS